MSDSVPRAEYDTAIAAAEARGRAAATERIRIILMHPEAKGREAMALVFALDSDMTPAAAIKAMTACPSAVARPTLDERQNPAVPADRPSRH